ncbi:hypothetical protein CPB83DRAFT_906222 [Crepidotus variabilis]|uniref:F-box domain-containing protein n=1 Tax=Crepidotus variabilis TaxID=179855 RepID=A0A9P6JQW2_9AGAR|nr:hypothetical protein CPB83DRAFT_906222 [Crepidotus variabilis]
MMEMLEGNVLPFYPDWIEAEIYSEYEYARLLARLEAVAATHRRLQNLVQNLDDELEETAAKTRLPPEILAQIFQRAIPPSSLLDSGLCRGPKSAWSKVLRTKKAIISVCRSWHSVGLPYLYEDISIRRWPQLPLLRRTLKELGSSHITRFIKSLEIQCYIPEESASDFDACFLDILDLCQSLTTFSFTPNCNIPTSSLSAARWVPQSVTKLRLGNMIPYRNLIAILFEVKETLQYLALQIGLTKQEAYRVLNATKKRLKGIKLPVLQDLFLEIGRWSFEPELLVITEFWTLPSLARLSIIQGGLRSSAYCSGADDYYLTADQMEECITALLARHGANITFLQIDWDWLLSARDPQESNENFNHMMAFCPLLDRLVTYSAIFFQDANTIPFSHPSLRWLDLHIGRSDLSELKERQGDLKCLTDIFPALEGIRQFVGIPPHAYEWLASFHPNPLDFQSNVCRENTTFQIFQHQLSMSRGNPVYIYWQVVEDTTSSGRGPTILVVQEPDHLNDTDISDSSASDYEYSSQDDIEESDGSDLDKDEYLGIAAKKETRAQRELQALD